MINASKLALLAVGLGIAFLVFVEGFAVLAMNGVYALEAINLLPPLLHLAWHPLGKCP